MRISASVPGTIFSKMSHPRCMYINNRCRCQSIIQQYLKRCLIKNDSNYMFRPIAAIVRFSSESMLVVLYRIGMAMSRWWDLTETCSYHHPLLNIFLDIVVLLTDTLHLLTICCLQATSFWGKKKDYIPFSVALKITRFYCQNTFVYLRVSYTKSAWISVIIYLIVFVVETLMFRLA